jgi:hypothetical protein
VKCWYCRSAPAEPGSAAQAPLYNDVRLADVQTTFDGYNIKKTWKVVKVPVPRCRRCAGAHATRGKLVVGFTFIPVLGVIVAAICCYQQLDGFIGVLVVSIIGGVVVGLLGWGLGRLAGWLVTPKDIPDEGRSKDYPTVQALVAQGWKLGSKPQPGEEFKNR